jgi:predicted negative regulator of RcsB-dependent stress response
MKLKPAGQYEADELDHAHEMLRDALDAAKHAGATKTVARIRLAISSVKGAQRHMSTRLHRTERGEL